MSVEEYSQEQNIPEHNREEQESEMHRRDAIFSRSFKRKSDAGSRSHSPPPRKRDRRAPDQHMFKTLDYGVSKKTCSSGCGYFMNLDYLDIVDDRGDSIRIPMAMDRAEDYTFSMTKGHSPAKPMRRKVYLVYRCSNRNGCNKEYRMTVDQAGKSIQFTEIPF